MGHRSYRIPKITGRTNQYGDIPPPSPVDLGTARLKCLSVAVGESKDIIQTVPEQKAIEGLFGVEQILTWKTAAVKRLDELELTHSIGEALAFFDPHTFWFYRPLVKVVYWAGQDRRVAGA